MQLSNDTSKNSTSPPYLVKNERSPEGTNFIAVSYVLYMPAAQSHSFQ